MNVIENDWKEAFTGHPKIGDVNSLKEKFSNTKEWADNEQAKVAQATDEIIQELAIANSSISRRNTVIFL